jgi:hypothetical protein
MEGTEAAVSSPAGTDGGASGGVDQSSYVSDAWDKNYFSSHEAELNPDKAKAQMPKAEVKPVVQPALKQAEPPKVAAKPNETQPEKQEPQASLFDQAFTGENGAFDVDGFLGFDVPNLGTEKPAVDIGQPPAVTEVKQEQWLKDKEEVETLNKNLTGYMLTPLEKAFALIQNGTDPAQALKQVYDKQKSVLEGHIGEIKNQKEFQRQKALEERLTEGTRTQAEKQQIAVNTNEIISSLPGKDTASKTALFNEVLFGKEVGAVHLDRAFARAYPDNEKMKPEERAVAAQKFVNSILSNKAELRYLFKVSLNDMKIRNIPKAMQQDRLRAIEDFKNNKLSAQKAPMGTVKRTALAVGKNMWDGYFNSHITADRV